MNFCLCSSSIKKGKNLFIFIKRKIYFVGQGPCHLCHYSLQSKVQPVYQQAADGLGGHIQAAQSWQTTAAEPLWLLLPDRLRIPSFLKEIHWKFLFLVFVCFQLLIQKIKEQLFALGGKKKTVKILNKIINPYCNFQKSTKILTAFI